MDLLASTVLKAMLTKSGWAQYSDIVTPDILTDNLSKSLLTHITGLQTGLSDVTPGALRLDVEATYRQGESRAEELQRAIDQLDDAPEVGNLELQDAIHKFAVRQNLAQAARYTATHLSETDLDVNVVADYVNRAMEVGTKVHATVTDLFESDLPGASHDRTMVCPTGLASELDRMLGGGVASGELFIMLAPPKRGKTTFLCTIGARAAASGKGVLHITLEISERRVVRRYETVWTGLRYEELLASPRLVSATRKKIQADGGQVYIQDWSHQRDKTPNDIKALVNRLRSQGKRVDVVIVDYLALMQPNGTKNMARREMRHVYSQLGVDMRATGAQLGVPVYTAWQVNRKGNDVDTPNQEHVAESWDIIMHADILVSLAQSAEEKRQDIMRIPLLEHRFSKERGVVHLHSDMDRCNIRALGDLEVEPTPVAVVGEEDVRPSVAGDPVHSSA